MSEKDDQVMQDTPSVDEDTSVSNTEEVPVEESKSEEYPVYTPENPMKLPVEEEKDFVLGIDFGNITSVISIAKLGEISHYPFVLHNTLGDLSHSAMVSFNDARVLGADANSQLILNPKETVFDLKFLNERKYDENEVNQYPFKIIEKDNTNNAISFNASYLSDNNTQKFYQLIACLLSTFSTYAESDLLYWQFRDKILRQRIPKDVPVEKTNPKGLPVKQCVIAIPSCYTSKQRASILDAASIAGLDVMGLIDEGIASALTYAISRRHDLKPTNSKSTENLTEFTETVVIADMGHSFFHIAIVQIGYNSMKVLHSSSLDIGANSFATKLIDHFRDILKARFKLENLSLRSEARLRRAVVKAMSVLSTVTQSHVEVDNFVDGIDIRDVITRGEFEGLCDDLLSKLSSHIENALKSANVDPASDFKVEIVGGGCRIPSVKDVITKVTGSNQLHYNLDSNNSVSIGASIYGSLIKYSGPLDLESENFEFISLEDDSMNESNERISNDELESAISQEKEMQLKDKELKDAQEIRNSFEQLIYQFFDHLGSYRNDLPEEEVNSIEQLLEKEKEWILYSEESSSCSFGNLKEHYDNFINSLKEASPKLDSILIQKKEEREKAEKEAAEAEANRKDVFRDKVKNPKTPKEKVEAAQVRKDQGNTFFKDNNYEHAVTRYLQAINLLSEIPGDKFTEDINTTKLSCHLNLGMCYINLKKYKLCIENCNMALRIDENNVKALFRRGKSKYLMKQYEEAKKDFVAAVDIDPSNTAAKKQINLCDKQMHLQKEREKKMYAKMFA